MRQVPHSQHGGIKTEEKEGEAMHKSTKVIWDNFSSKEQTLCDI